MSKTSLPRALNLTVRWLLILNLLLSFVPAPLLHSLGRSSGVGVAHAAPFVIAGKHDVLLVDNDNDGVADPGDTIRYTVVVTNTGFSGATNVNFIDTIDANTTLVDLTGNDYRTTPIARNDVYAAIGNVGITVPAGSGILVNDNDPDGTTPTLAIVSTLAGGTANGGAFSIGADGSFAYLPPPGFEGTDTFTYVVQDSDGNQDPAVVSIAVTGVIWFIDNTVGSGGNGTLFNPFDSLSDHNGNTADDNGDAIFLYSGGGAYSGGIILQNSQLLIGQGATTSLASIAGLTVPTHSNTLPGTGGTRPVITNGGGSGITLGSNNLLRGLNVGNTSTSSGAGLRGVSVGNLAIVEMSITGQGKAIDINGGGVLDVSLDTVAVTASTNGGVSLQNAGGTTSIGTLSLATTGGTGFLASNAGTVNVNSAGSSTATVNSSGGPGINVSNSTLNATFTGVTVANSSGIGVRLDTNGGTTNITGASNTVSTTGGTAVHVSNSTIGGSGMTFLSVSASATDVGIRLNNTGSGDFTVTGTGTTDGSGGTLGNLNDHGVEMINAQDVSLSNMNLTNAATTQEVAPNTATCTNLSNGTNTGCNAPVHMVNVSNVSLTNLTINGSVQHGVNGNNVNGLSISNTDVSNIGNQNKENGMHFINLLGTVSFNNVSVVGSNTRNVLIENNSGTANVTVTNSTFNTAGSEVGLDFLGLGTANITFSVTDSSFTDNNAPQLKALAEDNSTIDATITGNDFDGNPAVTGNSGVDLAAVDGGTLTFDVIGTLANPQTFQPFRSHAINVFASGGGTATGRVNGNTILGSALGAGIRVVAQVTDFNGFDPSITIEIDGNNIDQIEGGGLAGIHIEALDGTSGRTGTADIDATVTNNSVRTTDNVFPPVGGADAAIQVFLNDLNLASTPQNRVCLNATGNATQANGGAFGETDFFFGNDAISGSNSGVAQMQGFATSVSNTWFNLNGNTTTTAPTPLADSLGPIGGGTCGTVAQLLPSGNGTMVVESDDATLSVAAVGETTLNAASARVLLSAADLVESFVARFGDVTTQLVATRFEIAPEVARIPSTSRRTPGLARPALAPHASGETINLSLGDLNPGQVVVITFDVTVDSTIPANVTQVCNQGLFTGGNFANLLTDDFTIGGGNDPTCTSVPQADLEISKGDSADPVEPNFTFTYHLNVTNNGPSDAPVVAVTDTLTSGVIYVTDDCGAGSPVGQVWTWDVGGLDSGDSVGCNILVVAPGTDGTITNNVEVGSTTHDSNSANNTASETTEVGETVDLIVTQSESIDPVIAGSGPGNLTHIVTVTNNGPNDATGVEVTEALAFLSAGIVIDSITPSAGTSFSVIPAPPTWTIGNLANGASATLTLVYTVGSWATAGTDLIINTATVSAVDQGLINTNDDSSTVSTSIGRQVDLTVTIDESIDPVQAGSGPDNLIYTVTVLNNGVSDASNIAVNIGTTDPTGVMFNLGSVILSHGSFDGFVWTIPSLANGQAATLEYPVTVDNSAVAGTDVIEIAANAVSANETLINTGDDATIELTSIITNQPPVANNDSYSTNEDTALVEATVGPLGDGVLANDTDADSDPLTAVLDTTTSNGVLVLNSDGSFTYTPTANTCGADSFTYHANDGTVDSNIATVSINIVCINDAPVATDDSATTDEDTPVNVDVQTNDSAGPADEDPSLTTTFVTDPANGTATIEADGSVTYTPDADYNGSDSFDYTVCDSEGLCDTATVTITVNPVNDPPIANDDTANTDEDTPIVIDLQGNDNAGPANEDQTLVTFAISDPANGTATINPDGTVTYAPDLNFFGPDAFAYVVCDSGGLCDTAVVTIIVNPVDDPPVANDDSATVTEDDPATTINVLGNDTDIDGGPISIASVTQPANGTVVNNGTDLTYQPDADYCNDGSPTDDFTYTLTPGGSSATVRVTVVCVDDPPVVSVNTASQTVQYSDSIAPVTITATDVDSANLSISHNAPSDLSTSGGCTPDGTGGTTCTWTLSGQILVAAGTYDVIFTVSDATTGVTANTQVVVTPEAADVSFDGDNPVAVPVSSPGGDSEPFSLLVHVQESSESGSAVLPGDINLASVSVTLESVGPGSSVMVNCTSTGAVTAFDYSAVLEVACDFSGVPVNTYTIIAAVDGGYYSGSGEDVLVVYDPSLGFTTGGGWFFWPGTQDRTNFGYTMKYNKKGSKVQGNLLLIRHMPDGSIYRVKSNAIDGLALGDPGSFGWATFSGKSTYLEPGWPEPVGNHTFVAYVEDHGEPGAGADKFWIQVRDKDGNPVTLSMDPEAVANAVLLEGGNIVVPHEGGNGRRSR